MEVLRARCFFLHLGPLLRIHLAVLLLVWPRSEHVWIDDVDPEHVSSITRNDQICQPEPIRDDRCSVDEHCNVQDIVQILQRSSHAQICSTVQKFSIWSIGRFGHGGNATVAQRTDGGRDQVAEVVLPSRCVVKPAQPESNVHNRREHQGHAQSLQPLGVFRPPTLRTCACHGGDFLRIGLTSIWCVVRTIVPFDIRRKISMSLSRSFGTWWLSSSRQMAIRITQAPRWSAGVVNDPGARFFPIFSRDRASNTAARVHPFAWPHAMDTPCV
mmetsp:Transcript_6392/g.39877  ORF Transcript_6392/g.39877 Transcript_6392/m.39877 type:complete len:271 (+) Transcript_6392:1052-1864(+)